MGGLAIPWGLVVWWVGMAAVASVLWMGVKRALPPGGAFKLDYLAPPLLGALIALVPWSFATYTLGGAEVPLEAAQRMILGVLAGGNSTWVYGAVVRFLKTKAGAAGLPVDDKGSPA